MELLYVDVHTHTNFVSFNEDRDTVIARARDAGVWMIQVGTDADTSASVVALAHAYPEGIFASVGLHPTGAYAENGEEFNYDYYKKLAKDPKVVAIGECGLDYYRLNEETKKKQRGVFESQIALSLEVGKPLMLHIRNAYEDALDVLAAYPSARGNVHFFAGSWDIAKRFLGLGFTLSFTGVITFTHDYDEIIRNVPPESLLSETDAPFVAPVPFRGKRNEPAYVALVAKQIAAIRGEDEETVRVRLVENACRVFNLT